MTKMVYLTAGLLAGILLTSVAFATWNRMPAQDPAKLAPQLYKVVLDNDCVRVIDYRLQPGEKEPMHSHPSGVVVYFFTDAKMRGSSPDGKTTEIFNKAGEVIWREPVTHFGENIGSNEIHTLLVEPKNCRQ